MREIFVLDNAPVSEPGQEPIHSKPGIYLTDGSEMTIEVVDGRYILDEKDPARMVMMKQSLIAAGFRSAEVIPDEPAPEVKTKYEETIEFVHPDNTPGNLINATVRAAGKRLKVKDGLVKTDDPKVARALARKGYIVQNPHTLEREEGSDAARTNRRLNAGSFSEVPQGPPDDEEVVAETSTDRKEPAEVSTPEAEGAQGPEEDDPGKESKSILTGAPESTETEGNGDEPDGPADPQNPPEGDTPTTR